MKRWQQVLDAVQTLADLSERVTYLMGYAAGKGLQNPVSLLGLCTFIVCITDYQAKQDGYRDRHEVFNDFLCDDQMVSC